MKIRFLLLAATAFAGTQTGTAQVSQVQVDNGTTARCYGAAGDTACPIGPQPTVDIFVSDGAGGSSQVATTAAQTTIGTTDGTSSSRLNIEANGTALETNDPAFGSGALGTQTGTSAATGNDSGKIVGIAENAAGDRSELYLEGLTATLRTRGASGSRSVVETNQDRTLIGYAADGMTVNNGLLSDAIGNRLLGDTEVADNFSVTGTSSLNGLNNNGAGITNAGIVSGVTGGAVAAGSTEAVNGDQLFATNSNVATAQTTANTALTNAATAQTTANSALTNAATAQTTADNALTNAAAAQTTADTALADAAAAQMTADTALANAATAQTTADIPAPRQNPAATRHRLIHDAR